MLARVHSSRPTSALFISSGRELRLGALFGALETLRGRVPLGGVFLGRLEVLGRVLGGIKDKFLDKEDPPIRQLRV